MPQHIQAPDGSLVEFPDDMSDEAIRVVMQAHYGKDTRPKSFDLGFDQGFGHVVDNAALGMDRGLKAVGVPMDTINRAMGGKTTPEQVEANRAKIQARSKSAQPGGGGRLVGESVAGAPIMLATKSPILAGGLQGALSSYADSAAGVAVDTVKGAAFNKAFSKGADVVGDVLSPVIRPAVQRLRDAGMRLTPGQIRGGKAAVREEKAMSRPVVGDAIAAGRGRALETWNTATLNEALKPIGKTVPAPLRPGHDQIAWAQDVVEGEYDRIIPNLAVNLNPQSFVGKIAPSASSLKGAERDQLQEILSNQLGKGQLAGQQLKNAQAEIRRLGSTYRSSANADHRELGRVLGEADDELTTEMLRQNPKWAPELKKVNTAFRGLATVEDAASRADEGLFGTGQFKQSVRRADKSRRKKSSARGDAFMQDWSEASREVLPVGTPDSGTAGRLMSGNALAHLGGLARAGAYAADDAYQQIRLAPRSALARRSGELVRRARPLVGAIGAYLPSSQSEP